MKWAQTIPVVLALAGQTLGQAGPWGQCGGIGWSGATTCTSGWYCSTLNPYYSQCLQGTGPVTTTPVVTTTSSRTTTTTSSRTTTTTSSRTTTTTRTVTTFTTSSRTTTSSTTTTRPTTTRSDPPPASGTAIRGVSAPIYHKYLQEESGAAILGPEASQAKFVISGGYIRDVVSGNFLNIDTAATTSYKQLSFGTSPTFTGWGLEGDTIITTQGSIYGRQLNYVVCSVGSDKYSLYLQTGSQVPPGTCTNYLTIHLPCLC